MIGQPHTRGQAALRMLEAEGFVWDSYVDIFDGGPTVIAATDKIRTVREAAKALDRRDCATRAAPKHARLDGPAEGLQVLHGEVERDPRRGARDRPPRRPSCSRWTSGDTILVVRALMAIREINFDGMVGPSHNYAGLSLGNLASARNAGEAQLSARRRAPGPRQDALEHPRSA